MLPHAGAGIRFYICLALFDAATQLRVLKEADLITKKQGKSRLYSLNREKTLELVQFLEDI